jgi:hypothetical protein
MAARLSRWIGRDVEHRIEWSSVDTIKSAVGLSAPAEELGLGAGDRNARDLIPKWLPRS